MKCVVTLRNSPIIGSLLVLVVLLSSLFFVACDDVGVPSSETQFSLVPASYDGPVAHDYDPDDDWEWQIEPRPSGEYKYDWEIWSISASGVRNMIRSWEGSFKAYHRFREAGEYEISVDVLDRSTDDIIAEARARVITRKLILIASETRVILGQEVVFTLQDKNPPRDPVYEWDFRDDSGSQWETVITTERHTFEKQGSYGVSVVLREKGRTQYDYPGGESGYLAADSVWITVGHPATLLLPQPPLYAGLKYEFSLEYEGELPSGYWYWWEISKVGGWKTDSNKSDMTFPKEGNYTIRGEIRYHNDARQANEIYGFGQKTISVAKAPELIINVPAPPLQAGKEYTFAVHHESPGKLTEEPFYEWDFGDGSGIEIPFSNEATHAFAKEGKYTIRVTLFESDEEAAPLLGVATAEVIVEGQAVSTISYIQQTTHLLVAVRGGTTEHYSSGESRDGSRVLIIYLAAASTTWSDNHFTNKYFIIPTDSSSGIDLTIEGDVSDECDKIFNLTATIIYDDSHSLAGEQRESRIYLTNVPLEPKSPIPTTHDPNYKAHFVAYIEGVDVADYVTNTFYEHHQPQTNDPNYKIWYDPLKFENIEPIPYLLIVFKTYRIDAHDDPGYQKRD